MSAINFSRFMDKTLTLHDCSKIKKFSVHYGYYCNLLSHPQLTSRIHFAITKHVEELILHLSDKLLYELPDFIFDNASLLKLELFKCRIWDDRRLNWSSLKELKLECSYVTNLAIGNIVSGCALLESLELQEVVGLDNLVIASKSLKRLIFVDIEIDTFEDEIEISCPNLVELRVTMSGSSDMERSHLPDKVIENVLSRCPLLHTLELLDFTCFYPFLIASRSLKTLVLGEIYSEFEISCPKLEELNLYHFVPDVPTFDDFESESRWQQCLAMKMLQQAQHVKVLKIGCWFLKILSALDVEAPSSPLLNCKGLTLAGTFFDEQLSGIVYAIQNSPVLEKLEIKLHSDQRRELEYIWDSNEAVFKWSVSNLKTVKIVGLSQLNEVHTIVFDFVEFLLKNARMLENIFIILAANCVTDFLLEVSKKLISFQRCFPHITIELLRSN